MARFPLPSGCRVVCREKRSAVRHFKPKDICRIARSVQDAGYSKQEIRAALDDCGLCERECSDDLKDLLKELDDWLDALSDIPIEDIARVITDLVGLIVPTRWVDIILQRLKVLKYLLRLQRVVNLANDIIDLIRFINETKRLIVKTTNLIEGPCRGEDNGSEN